MPDLAAPYIQRGIVEVLLLAVIAGVLGTWVVLRRLPFYTHAIGTATFPGLVVAGPWGVPAQLTALACAVGFGGVLERIQRSRRIDTDAAIGLLLVAALAIGVVLASDVYESGAGVDRLLFGSLIALTPLDLWLTAAAAVAALAADGAMRRSWLATGFDPDGARSVGVRTARADRVLLIAVAIAVVVALDAVGALLVTVVLTVPAATVRLFEPSLRTQQLATFGLAAVEGLLAIVARRRLQRRPGADDGGHRCARVWRGRHHAEAGARMIVSTRDLKGGYVRGADVLGGVTFAVEAGEIAGVLGPNGGGKTTLFRALLGELPYRSGDVELAGRPAYVPQTESARLDFPVTAHDVALMGAYGRTPWFKRVARADRERADAALARVGLADRAHDRFGALSGGQRQRVLIARALVQDAPVLLLDEPLSGVDHPSAIQIERVFGELRAEGRALLVATHDVAQARAWPRVLCLNHGQVAFGEPESVLTTNVLRATYGDELVILDGSGQAVTVSHHHHHHH